MIYFVSDSHYHHSNIVKGVSKWSDKSGCRNFNTIEEHDDWIVNLINAKVKADDFLYHLGDWSFGGKAKIAEFASRLHCEKIYILPGNHDHHILDAAAHDFILPVKLIPAAQYMEVSVDGMQIVLSHYPIESWNNMERGSIHLHGHTHGQLRQIPGRYDVGVDALGLMSLEQVKLLPKATTQRHTTIEGGNKFA